MYSLKVYDVELQRYTDYSETGCGLGPNQNWNYLNAVVAKVLFCCCGGGEDCWYFILLSCPCILFPPPKKKYPFYQFLQRRVHALPLKKIGTGMAMVGPLFRYIKYYFFLFRYIYGCVRQDKLAAYYRDATVGLITPLRDGMNLVAKV